MNIKDLQITPTPKNEKLLHSRYGHEGVEMVRGAGELHKPRLMLLFMNPTARNVSSDPNWKGLRAPWIGTKQVWKMLTQLGLLKEEVISDIYNLKPEEWTEENTLKLYSHVAKQGLYITNLASCTQPDARALKDSVFREYIPVIHSEISIVQPQKIVTLGNQVSSILLQKNISVSNYPKTESEDIEVEGKIFKVFPTYYPVGQGQRNMQKAIERVSLLLQ